MWQEDADGISTQALLMEGYSDVIKVTQAGHYINLKYDVLTEFISQLNALKNEVKR